MRIGIYKPIRVKGEWVDGEQVAEIEAREGDPAGKVTVLNPACKVGPFGFADAVADVLSRIVPRRPTYTGSGSSTTITTPTGDRLDIYSDSWVQNVPWSEEDLGELVREELSLWGLTVKTNGPALGNKP